MTRDNTAAAAVAELDSVLKQVKAASSRKTAAEMHEQGGGSAGKPTSLNANTPAADDGDQPLAEGERAREDVRDVRDQQPLSHENTTGAADSPQFNNAPDETGAVLETDADAEDGKQMHHPDTQYGTTTSHPARTDNPKIAALLAIAEEYEEEEEGGEGEDPHAAALARKGDDEGGEEGEEDEEDEEGEGGGMPPEATMPADPGLPAMEPSEEELAEIDALLGGVDPKLAATIPDLPIDEDGLQKVASEDPTLLDDYVEKTASVYPDEVQNGYLFAQNVFAGIHEHAKTAGGIDDETKAQIDHLRKRAFADAGNVAEIVEGIEEGDAVAGDEGVEDPLAGGEGMVEEEVSLDGAGDGGDAAGEAEALLAALQQSGVADDNLMKAAAAAGFAPERAKAVLAKVRKN